MNTQRLEWVRAKLAAECGLTKDKVEPEIYNDANGDALCEVGEWRPESEWWQAKLCAETYAQRRGLLWGVEQDSRGWYKAWMREQGSIGLPVHSPVIETALVLAIIKQAGWVEVAA